MTHYAIGDIQGCYDQLIRLLHKLQFSAENDTLWFTGDLVSRGPKSLETLRFVSKLPHTVMVLGNHDLRLLAYAFGNHKSIHSSPTLSATLQAPDLEELCHWLRHQPLLHHDSVLGYTLVHAGLAPQWELKEALSYAHEVETVLQGNNYSEFLTMLLQQLNSNEPIQWNANLTGYERLIRIVNYFTRIRFCDKQGRLELKTKDRFHPEPHNYLPWFHIPERKTQNLNIIFGHWAALHGETGLSNVYAIDTGCDHGYKLTAMCLEDSRRITVPCYRQKKS